MADDKRRISPAVRGTDDGCMDNTPMNRGFVDRQLDRLRGHDLEAIFHDLRKQVI